MTRQGLDNKLVETIEREIMQEGSPILWEDIAGLEYAKKTINETIVLPLKKPELFRGLRKPPKGLLFFGPPGTGKTMIGKAVASQLKHTFFNMSASSLTSKWVGEGEKLVKTLFQLAILKQPSVIFIDEIDSLLCSRSENDNESSRRIKTEFLVQLDGAKSVEDHSILLIGATNRPDELDEAARRRFTRRLYIPLPDSKARNDLIKRNIVKDVEMGGNTYEVADEEILDIVRRTKGYSAADIQNLLVETAMAPLRDVDLVNITADQLRPITYADFVEAMKTVLASDAGEDQRE